MKKISGLYPGNVYIYTNDEKKTGIIEIVRGKRERRHNIYYRTLLDASNSVYFMYAKSGCEARAPGLLKAPWPPVS